MTRVLIVDDEPQLLRALVLNLRNRGYDRRTFEPDPPPRPLPAPVAAAPVCVAAA
jgi:CheY-like chemotaxis protein